MLPLEWWSQTNKVRILYLNVVLCVNKMLCLVSLQLARHHCPRWDWVYEWCSSIWHSYPALDWQLYLQPFFSKVHFPHWDEAGSEDFLLMSSCLFSFSATKAFSHLNPNILFSWCVFAVTYDFLSLSVRFFLQTVRISRTLFLGIKKKFQLRVVFPSKEKLQLLDPVKPSLLQ